MKKLHSCTIKSKIAGLFKISENKEGIDMKIKIKNGKIITPDSVLEGYAAGIADGRIESIKKENEMPDSYFDKIVDAGRDYISPGFIDIHNHGNSGHDVMEGTYEALNSMASFHISNGITSFLATTMTDSIPKTKKVIKTVSEYIKNQYEDRKCEKAEVLGLYLEGPYFSMAKKGAQPGEYIKLPDIKELDEFINISNNKVKIVSMAPELEGVLNAVDFLKNRGITVSAGHSDAKFDEMNAAIEHGVTEATHIYNGMRSFNHREPGIIGAALTDKRVNCEMICDGIHIHPAAMKMVYMMKGKDGLILISDAMMAAGLQDGKYKLGVQNVYVKNGEARLEDGTLAGSTLTLNKAVYNMVHLVGVPLVAAVKMASLNPAEAAGCEDRKGSIAEGKDADIIIFDKNIKIKMVIKAGKIVNI